MLKRLKTNKLILVGMFIGMLLVVFLLPNFVFAGDLDVGLEYGNKIGLGSEDPRIIIVKIIRVLLGFIGIISVLFIMYAGWLWMVSGGDEAKISQAKKTLKNAIVGLIIILSSFAIATFILHKLSGAIGTGGLDDGGEPPSASGGIGALGDCTIKSVYPEPDQKDVPRNTSIIITFREEVDPTTICDDAGGNNNGVCDTGEYIIADYVKIFHTTEIDNCLGSDPCNSQVFDVNVATNDNKTYIFLPVNWLGSPSEYIWYTVYLSNDIRKLADGKGVFDTCKTDYFEWNFEVNNKIDLEPPQVLEGWVFPPPDNEADEVGTETAAVQAEGSVTVNSQPQVYAAATVQNPPTPVGPSENATVNGVYNCQEDGTITVSINGNTGEADVDGPIGVVTGDDITDNIASLGCGLTLTPDDGDFTAGDSWTIAVTAEKQADTLTVGSTVYTFGVDIESDSDNSVTAGNIAAALSGHPAVTASVAVNVVTITAKVAGADGNNIILTSDSSGLDIVPMSGGQDSSVTTTINDKKDKPRNTVIQINFNEAINPLTISGNANDLQDGDGNYYIKVVNNLKIAGDFCSQDKECASNVCSGNLCVGGPAALLNNGQACSSDRECLSFNCDVEGTNQCIGDVIDGEFVVSNQYKTVEFISNNLCGVNGCGEQIYCLPENSHLRIALKAADLAACIDDNDCVDKTPYNDCVEGHCYNSSAGENYPLSSIPLSGIADAALNSLDGNRDGDADGPNTFYNENSPNLLDGDNYQWSFFVSDQIDLEPPMITLTSPIHTESGISLTDPILINFNKIMMSGSLSTGSIEIFNGKDYIMHQLINLWNFTNQPIGYWITNENKETGVPDNEPDWTQAQINHSMFTDSTSYRAQVGSGVKDIYQNCFKPSSSSACIGNPSCCGEAPNTESSCP